VAATTPSSTPAPFATRGQTDGRHALPPPAAGEWAVVDTGDATPRAMRPTLHALPATSDLLRASHLPLAVVITPLAPPGPGDSPLPLIDLFAAGSTSSSASPDPLPRCPTCRAYANPGWIWHEDTGGATFTCNLCGKDGDAPPGWGAPGVEAASGARADAAARPELCRGSVEYVAPPAFCARPPRPPARLFVLDASFGAVASGLLAAGADAVAGAVAAMPPHALVGLAVFDAAVHFYALGSGGGGGGGAAEEPAVLVVPDISSPFAPAPPARLLAPAGAALAPLQALLARLPSAFADTRVVSTAGGAALTAAADAVAAAGGGRVTALLGGPPRSGFLSLAGGRPVGGAGVDAAPTPRPALTRPPSAGPRAAGPEPVPPASAVGSGGDTGVGPASVGPLTPPPDCGWPAWASTAAERQVAVDVTLAPPGGSGAAASAAGPSAAADAAALRAACDGTGGVFAHYPAFSAPSSAPALAADWAAAVASPHAGWEGVGRLRASAGLVVTSVAGPVHRRVPGDVDFPGLGPDTTLIVSLAHDGVAGALGGGGGGGEGGAPSSHAHRRPSPRPRPPPEACLQWALAYTTPAGARRVRVHTLRLPIAESLGALFRGADADALGVVWAAGAAAGLAASGGLAAGREAARGAAVPALASYRSRCAASAGAGQLILPEALKLAPLAGLALSKSAAWAPRTPPDERAVAAGALAAGRPPARLARALAPRLLPLHLLLPCPLTGAPPPGWPSPDGSGPPCPLPLSAEAVDSGGVYLLAGDGAGALWFGPASHHAWAGALLAGEGGLVSPATNATAAGLAALAARLGAARGEAPLRVTPLKRGPAGDATFYGGLVEDRGVGGPSYVEHLCWVHRQVQKALT